VIIDRSEEAFRNLSVDFRGRTVVGEAMSRDVLLRAGIEDAIGLAAVTSNDAVNAVVAHIAQVVYQVPNVVVRNFDSRFRSMHEAFNLQVVSSSSWGAQRVEELLYHQQARTVFSAGNGEVEIYEFTIPDAWDGHPLAELFPGHNCLPVAVSRAGQARMPDAGLVLAKGDAVLVSATLEGSQALQKKLHDAVQ
jgi:trk system potassium uptake protein TrkA